MFLQGGDHHTSDKKSSTTKKNKSSYAQTLEESKRSPSLNSGENKTTCYRFGREGHILSKCTHSTKFTGEQINYSSTTAIVHPSHVSDGMIDTWEHHVDDEGYGCLSMYHHHQKLPVSIVQYQQQKTMNKK